MSEDDSEMNDIEVDDAPAKSLVVQLRYRKTPQPPLATNGLTSHAMPENEDAGQELQRDVAVEPASFKPAMATLEPPDYPPTSLPHHFSPATSSQAFMNGTTSSEPRERASERLPEQPLYQQAQAVQYSKVA